jgi:hypothetical protein
MVSRHYRLLRRKEEPFVRSVGYSTFLDEILKDRTKGNQWINKAHRNQSQGGACAKPIRVPIRQYADGEIR